MDLNKIDGEDDIKYLLRLVGYKLEDKSQELEWEDIVEKCDLGVHRDVLRKAMQPATFGAYAIYKYMLKNGLSDDETIKLLDQKILESKIEVQKLRDLRMGYTEKEIRGVARKQALLEEIQYFIKDLKPIKVPELKEIVSTDKKMICGVADCHFGKELLIEGLDGSILNEYNEDIFYQRMWNLMEEYIYLIKKEQISKIVFFDLSDSISGILRQTDLMHIKYGIIESSIKYAHFMAQWLNELSSYVYIDYYACKGNHCELRLLNSKSGEFGSENTQIIIDEMLKLALLDNKRININDTKDLQYVDIDGYKVLATHGQNESNLVTSVKEYKEIYNVDIDLMLTGHLHSSKQETASLRSKVIQFPSMIGIDDFSMKIKKTAKAEAKAIIKEGKRLTNIDIEV